MVGPIDDEERRSFETRVKVGITVLIGLSAGLITLQGDPSLVVVLGAIVAGLLVSAPLVWFVFPESSDVTDDRRRRRP
jgi:cell division protein FtsW (lipid II flippase)